MCIIPLFKPTMKERTQQAVQILKDFYSDKFVTIEELVDAYLIIAGARALDIISDDVSELLEGEFDGEKQS